MSVFFHGTTIEHAAHRLAEKDEGVGQSVGKIDAVKKLLGRIPYTDDIALPHMVFAKIKRSAKAHARIVSINAEKALNLPGVLAVITGDDLKKTYGVIPWTKDEYPLAYQKVRFVGDAVAAVAAVDELTAIKALKLIDVQYEELPAILTVTEAKNRPEIKVNEHAKVGNITKQVSLSFGDVLANKQKAFLTLKHNFRFHNTTHTPIEPHCAIGDFSPDGLLTVYSATQVPHYVHRALSEVLEIPSEHIRVIQPPVGGAFGGKSEPFDLEFVVAKLSMMLKRPVKCLYTREEVFYAHRGRHPMDITCELSASEDGTILALENHIDIDGGAYASFGMITAFYAGQLLTGPVGFQSYAFHSTRYYTNKPACGPKRGHGSVQPRFALEIMLDICSEKLKIDPFELRKRNFVGEHQTTINGQKIGSLGFGEVLDKVAKASGWIEKRGQLPEGFGMGMASSMYISGTNYPVYPNEMPQSSVIAKLDRSGRVTIFSQGSDIGQGINTILSQIATEELGVHPSSIQVIASDTDLTPVDLGAYSSRVTLMLGHAALEAFRKLRIKLAQACAQKLPERLGFEVPPDELYFASSQVFLKNDPNPVLSLKDAIVMAEEAFGTLVAQGSYRTKDRGGAYRGGTIGASPAYSCTAHVALVFVDKQTGAIHIKKIWVAHDCGRAINPMLVEGQMEGSTYMGAAETILEDFITDTESGARKGLLLNPSLLDYRIPTSKDTPLMESLIVEQPDPMGPYGAKEAGEGPLHSSIPAIANAVYDAVGIRLFDLPFTPAKVLRVLEEKARRETL